MAARDDAIPGDELPPDCSFDIGKVIGYAGLLWHKCAILRDAISFYADLVRGNRPVWQSLGVYFVGIFACFFPHIAVGALAVVPFALAVKAVLVARAYRPNKRREVPAHTYRDFIPQARVDPVTGAVNDAESLAELMRVYRRRMRATQAALVRACDALDAAWAACTRPSISVALRAAFALVALSLLIACARGAWVAAAVWTHQFVRWSRPYNGLLRLFEAAFRAPHSLRRLSIPKSVLPSPAPAAIAEAQRVPDIVEPLEVTESIPARDEDVHTEAPVTRRPIREKISEIRSEIRRRQTQNAGHCTSCHASFGLLNRRLCCAQCGSPFCGNCCENLVTRAMLGATSPAAFEETVNVCNGCYESLTGHKIDRAH